MRDDDSPSDAVADDIWKRANAALFPPCSHPTPPPPDWRLAQETELNRPVVPTPWTIPTWQPSSSDPDREPAPRVPYLSHRRGYRTATIRALDPDNLLRHEPPPHPNTYDDDSNDSPRESFATAFRQHRPNQYASALSSFRGGTAANAFCSVRDLTSRDPFATRSIIVGLDSYSDVTVAHRDIVYDIHPITETVHTGAGEATYTEEGRVDIADGLVWHQNPLAGHHSNDWWVTYFMNPQKR
jgi:hypothetical protein